VDADDRTVAEALVSQLERDPGHQALIADPLARARAALERGTRLRAAADEPHARVAEGLAREWAETARDLVAAADEEAHAAEVRTRARDAQAQLERTRALVEEGIARVGRLRAAIADAERERLDARTAVEVHEGEPKPVHRPKNQAPKPPPAAPKPPGAGAPMGADAGPEVTP
jgi:hypothetical protein